MKPVVSKQPAIDLRTKLIFLLAAPQLILFNIPFWIEIILVLLYLSLFLFSRDYKWIIFFLVVYSLQVLVFNLLGQVSFHPFLLFILSFLSIGLRQMILSIIAGAFLLKTTAISEWTATLTKLKAPKGLKIGLAVLTRFIITVIHDFNRIRQALLVRGIDFSPKRVLTHPVNAFEYLIIPLLMNTSFTARDLTIAALTKGLDSKAQQTSYRTYTLSGIDYSYWLALAVVTIGGILAWPI